jgi:hypothetical protein
LAYSRILVKILITEKARLYIKWRSQDYDVRIRWQEIKTK